VKDLCGSNLIRKSPWLQTNLSCTQVHSKNRTESEKADVFQPRESSKYVASHFHSQTLPRPPKRFPGQDRGAKWRDRNQNKELDCSEKNNNRVKFLVQSFENHVLRKVERPRNDGITSNSISFVSPPKEFEDKEYYQTLENKDSFDTQLVSNVDEEIFPSQAAFQINELPKVRKKIPPKVAPKPNRKYDIDFSEPKALNSDLSFSLSSPGVVIHSSGCLATLSDTESFDRKPSYGDSPDTLDKSGESLMSFSGVNSDSGMYSLRETSDLNPKFCTLSRSSGSGINSQSSTISSCASTGIFENEKTCESIPFDGDNDKEKKNMEVHDKTCNMRVFQEEEDCEEMIAELTSYFSPASTVPHSQATGKSRDNILREVLGLHNSYLNSQFDSKEEEYQWTDCNRNFRNKSEVQNFDRMKMELRCKIVAKLKSMRSKESWIQAENQENSQGFKRIEEKLRIIARTYEVDKFKLHIMEIEKIMSLILGLSYRLIPVEHSLYNMEWNGVDERYDLERKRDKLVGQLEEAKLLWCSIDKRTGVVAGYIEQYLPYQDVINFRQLVKTKLNQMVEMKELQEKIGEGERQLRAVKLLVE